MNGFSITQIAEILRGRIIGNTKYSKQKVHHYISDSRTFFNSENSLFFALVGPRNNGHDYISALIDKGIRTFVISDAQTASDKATFIVVKNTTAALQQLAAFHRKQYNYPVIGITGSNGKTIIKEWLHDLLSDTYKIVRSPKSYNSQIGVPLSVLLMQSDFNLALFEAGISEPREMSRLEKIISPELGIFTNIGDAHQENFHSLQQKVQEKLQLFKRSKLLIYNADSELINQEVKRFSETHSVKNIAWSFTNEKADIYFSVLTKNGISEISAKTGDKYFQFKIPFGDYSAIENSCHCFAAVYALLEDPVSVLPHFEKLANIEMRLEIKQGINNSLLVNDYYNSDLNSLSIALTVLNQQAAKKHLYKKVILSDIQQSGLSQEILYRKVNQLLCEWKIDEIIGIGQNISSHAKEFSISKHFYPSINSFQQHFKRADYGSSAILIKGARQFTFEKISELLQQQAHQTELVINLNALVNNLNVFRNLLKPETKIMVMVKAFSYGSGDVEIAKLLQYQNIDYLAVAVADEGVQLRNAGIRTPIVVMNPEQSSFQNIIEYQLEPNLYSIELLKNFQKSVSQYARQNFPVHIKIDTGMNRLGLKTETEIKELVQAISATNGLKIKSVFSHLAASDEPQLDDFTQSQFDRFDHLYNRISKELNYKIDRHILNSAGIERFPGKQFEMVRLGIGLYGVSATNLPLENIGTLKSTVSQVKNIDPNETIGYGRKGEVSGKSKIAIIPLGYADGLDRKLGNKNGNAFIHDRRVPIIGNICMDMTMLDVTGMDVQAGDKVEFLGPNISILEVVENVATIPYEILTGISQRVKRVYVQE